MVHDAGKLVAAYFWPYHGTDTRYALQETCQLALDCGADILPNFADIEDYKGVSCTRQEVEDIADEADKHGITVGFYSTETMLARAGHPDLAGRVGWVAGGLVYNIGTPEPTDIEEAPALAGLSIRIWQWTSVPCDRNIVDVRLPRRI